MKVCYVTHLPNLTGANRSLLDMLDGIDRGICLPFVLLNSHGPIESELKKRDINYKIVFYSPATNSDNKLKNIAKAFLNTGLMNWLAVQLIKGVLKKEKVDLVHSNSYIVGAGMEAARDLKIPYICHIRDFVWEDHHRKFFNVARQVNLLKNATRVIAITNAIKNKFQPSTLSEIQVLMDGINVEEYVLPYKSIFEKKEINIIMAGRISPGKGQMEAIQAVELLQKQGYYNIKLHVVGGIGDDNYYQRMHQYVEENSLNFMKFYEFTNDLKGIRAQCDIGLTCSKAEALGRVTIENMLSSLLVIAGRSAGSEEVVKDKQTGLFYETGSYTSLSEAIVNAIKEPELSNNIVKAGHEEAKLLYDNKKYGKDIIEVYDQLMKSKSEGTMNKHEY